jgi:hypothetical protein
MDLCHVGAEVVNRLASEDGGSTHEHSYPVADATLADASHNEEIRLAQVRQHPLFREFVGEAIEVAIKRVEPEVPRGAGRSRRLPIPPALAAFEDTVGRRAGGGLGRPVRHATNPQPTRHLQESGR